MAGVLDTSRFKYFLSQELNVPISEVDSFVLGGHGDTMVPVPNRTMVSGENLTDLVNKGKISKARLDEIIDRTRKGGAEVVKLLETGSAFYGPAASGIEMADSYLNDKITFSLVSLLQSNKKTIKQYWIFLTLIAKSYFIIQKNSEDENDNKKLSSKDIKVLTETIWNLIVFDIEKTLKNV